VGKKLSATGRTIAVAESCTGGLLGKLLTDVPGSSKYFIGGWITYSNKAKVNELGIDSAMIEEYGAVSEQVCAEMARGARKKAGTDFAIAITGIAGPGGETEQKPAGLVYISIDSVDGCRTRRFVLPGERVSVRLRTAQTALNLLLRSCRFD
jgi:nicotinamide-nucleotide amidase